MFNLNEMTIDNYHMKDDLSAKVTRSGLPLIYF